MTDELSTFDVMYNTRAMRRLKPDPVAGEVLVKLVDAAIRAPSGSNVQNWAWIVVRDAEQKTKLAELNRQAVAAYTGPGSRRATELPHQDAARRQRQLQALLWQAEHMHEFPAIIIPCLELRGPRRESFLAGLSAGGSIWPAVQNLMLAARALGLGAALTTLALGNRPAFREVLRLPGSVEPVCVLPVGYPLGRFGPVSRRPVAEVLRWDRWS